MKRKYRFGAVVCALSLCTALGIIWQRPIVGNAMMDQNCLEEKAHEHDDSCYEGENLICAQEENLSEETEAQEDVVLKEELGLEEEMNALIAEFSSQAEQLAAAMKEGHLGKGEAIRKNMQELYKEAEEKFYILNPDADKAGFTAYVCAYNAGLLESEFFYPPAPVLDDVKYPAAVCYRDEVRRENVAMMALALEDVEEANHFYSSVKEDTDSNAIYLKKNTMLDSEKHEVAFIPTQEQAAGELSKELAAGEMAVSKTGIFASQEDAQNEIAKLNFDVVGKGVMETEPADVLFIMDESGSMNMCYHHDGNKENDMAYTWSLPCMNPKHFYCIENKKYEYTSKDGNVYSINSNTTEYFSFYDKNILGDKKSVSYMDKEIWKNLKDIYGITESPEGQDSAYYMLSWKPWENHFRKVGENEYQKISCETEAKIPDAGHYWFSPTSYDASRPIDYDNDCYDRTMIMKQGIANFSKSLLGANTESRVALVGYAQDVVTKVDFTNDFSTLNTALSDTRGYQHTNYVAGINQAIDFIENREDKSRPCYVVFISDGAPDKEDGCVEAAEQIKGTNIEYFYTMGIQVDESAMSLLKNMASFDEDGTYSANCAYASDINQYLKDILNDVIIGTPIATLKDEIGEDFQLVVDETHPLTVGGVSYTSIENAEKHGVLQVEKSDGKTTVIWKNIQPDEAGTRISLFVEPKNKTIKDAYEVYLETNGEAKLSYKKLDIENGAVTGTSAEITVPSPIMHLAEGSVTAVKSSNPEDGTAVKQGDKIQYTITLKNEGAVDMDSFTVRDYIPEKTVYVSCENDGIYTEGIDSHVDWEISGLEAGKSASVVFNVKVTGTSGTVLNSAIFGTTMEESAPALHTNEVKHFISSEDPKPEDPKPEDPKPEDPKPEDPKPQDPAPETPLSPSDAAPQPSLIQTGQLNWPVPVLAAIGLILLASGCIIIRTKERS